MNILSVFNISVDLPLLLPIFLFPFELLRLSLVGHPLMASEFFHLFSSVDVVRIDKKLHKNESHNAERQNSNSV